MRVFNLTNASRAGGSKKEPIPSLHLASSGCITLSKELCIALKITEKTRIAVVQGDTDVLDWYLHLSDNPDSFPLRPKRDTGQMMFNSALIVEMISAALKDSGKGVPDNVRGFALPVSTNPDTIDGTSVYFILPKPIFRKPKDGK